MMPKWLFLVYLLIPVLGIYPAYASDYTIPVIKIEVNIADDGTVYIDEHRTYRFDGDFSWADYRLPKEGFSDIRNIRVSEQDEVYINENSEDPGTFSVSQSNSSVVIKWHYIASDTTRTFSVSYELLNAVSIGPDWSELFWNYLAAGRERSTEILEININLPEDISTDSLYAWSRGEKSTVIQKEPGHWSITAQNISASESVIARVLFPTEVFNLSQISVTDPVLTLEEIIRDEETYSQHQRELKEREEFYASITGVVTILIIFFSIGLFSLFYLKFGKRYPARAFSKRETVVIPDRIEPAIIGRLMTHRQTTIQHFTATLFDLARRGFFTIHEEEKEKTWYSSDTPEFRIEYSGKLPDDNLTDWEKDLLFFVQKRLDTGKQTIAKLFEGSGQELTKWYSEWKKKVSSAFNDRNWIDRNSYKGAYLNVFFQLLLGAASIFMIIMGTSLAIPGLIAVCLMIIASGFIPRRTREGEETYQRWNAYRDGLKNADKRTIRTGMLDRHFIYATAFHLSQKQITSLIKYSDDERTSSLFPWIFLIPGSAHSPASIALSISTMAATGSSSFPGVSGGTGAATGSVGGGASGGAG